jgi:Tol biopolymer transport system component
MEYSTTTLGRLTIAATLLRAAALALTVAFAASAAHAAPGDNHVVSVSELTGNAAGRQWSQVSISGNGRYVAFNSTASTIVAGDTNGVTDVFVRDLLTATTERISIGIGGVEADADSSARAISGDGRYVLFWSSATNLVADAGSEPTSYVRDRWTQRTERALRGMYPPFPIGGSSISDDGRFITMEGGGTFLSDRLAGTTTELGPWQASTISGNGRYILYSNSTDYRHLFLWDRLTSVNQRISKYYLQYGFGFGASISSDGRWVAFSTYGRETPEDENSSRFDVFLWDRLTGVTKLVNVNADGMQDNGGINEQTSVSNDGRYVAFSSNSTNLVEGMSEGSANNIFVKDMQTGAVERVSGDGFSYVAREAFSDDGRSVVLSTESRLVANDRNLDQDAYLHETGRTSTLPWVLNLYLRPLAIEYGPVALGTASKKGFTLTNGGITPLPINTIELLGAERGQYALKSYCGATLEAGSHCWISVTFRPTLLGYKQADLHVVAGGIDRHRALQGTGVN